MITTTLAESPEYQISSDKSWFVVDDHAAMKEKNTIQIKVVSNDKLPAKYSISVVDYTNHTNFKNNPAIIGNDMLKFHQPQQTGIDTVYYEVCKDGGECLKAIAVIKVVENNDKPTAARDVAVVDQNESVEVDVFLNDYGNSSVTVGVINSPDNGSYVVSGKTIKYTPNKNFIGKDSLTYQVCDGNCSQNKFVIYVLGSNQPPKINDIEVKLKEDNTYNFMTNDFLSSYTDPANISLNKIKIVSLPDNGLLYYKTTQITALQEIDEKSLDQLSYVPDNNYNGEDSWQWSASNGKLFAEKNAKVIMQVESVNDAPEANKDQVETNEDQPLTIDVLANDNDVDGDPLTLISVEALSEVGEITIDENQVLYTPHENYNGSFTVTYTISDGEEKTSAEIEVTVKSINDLPSISNFQVNLEENDQYVFSVAVFESNFSDEDHATLNKVEIIQLPANGKLYLFDNRITGSVEVIFNDLDNLKYIPNQGFSGEDNLVWNASDGVDYAKDPAQLKLNVADINFAPVANDDNGNTTNEDVPIAIDVLANDSDDDGDPLTISNTSEINTGTLAVDSENKIVFTPTENYSGSFTFTYQITDIDGLSDQATVSVIVLEENDLPIIEDISIELIQNMSHRFSVQDFLDNYQDVESDEFKSVIIKQLPSYGVLKLQDIPLVSGQSISPFALDDLTYEPNKNYIGDDIVVWNASDGEGFSNQDAVIDISIRRFTGQVHAFKAISPNGDGKNDEWIIEGIDLFPDNLLRLYDRNGNLVISIPRYDNQQQVWRGERNKLGSFNNLVEDGTYFYVIELGDGINQVKGYVIVQK